MKAEILDIRQEARGTCYLCRASLAAFIENLPDEYSDYVVQRGYVSNPYLDTLVQTVIGHRYIPAIVLVADKPIRPSGKSLETGEFKILDGLQRTFRLHAIHETIKIFLEARKRLGQDVYSLSRLALLRQFSDELKEADSNIGTLLALREYALEHRSQNLPKLLSENFQWFEVWSGLSAEDEIRLMLMLNAGHKPVGLRHQLELLFLSLLPMLKKHFGKRFNLVRERDRSATRFSKGREVGDFHFAHMISALLSLSDGKPITPNAELIQAIQSPDDQDIYDDILRHEYLRDFVSFIVDLDELISQQYSNYGATWMGREVALTGIFGAIGSASKSKNTKPKIVMQDLLKILEKNPLALDLKEFEKQRNTTELSKVNIGQVNKIAVFNGIRGLLLGDAKKKIDWKKMFSGAG